MWRYVAATSTLVHNAVQKMPNFRLPLEVSFCPYSSNRLFFCLVRPCMSDFGVEGPERRGLKFEIDSVILVVS